MKDQVEEIIKEANALASNHSVIIEKVHAIFSEEKGDYNS